MFEALTQAIDDQLAQLKPEQRDGLARLGLCSPDRAAQLYAAEIEEVQTALAPAIAEAAIRVRAAVERVGRAYQEELGGAR